MNKQKALLTIGIALAGLLIAQRKKAQAEPLPELPGGVQGKVIDIQATEKSIRENVFSDIIEDIESGIQESISVTLTLPSSGPTDNFSSDWVPGGNGNGGGEIDKISPGTTAGTTGTSTKKALTNFGYTGYRTLLNVLDQVVTSFIPMTPEDDPFQKEIARSYKRQEERLRELTETEPSPALEPEQQPEPQPGFSWGGGGGGYGPGDFGGYSGGDTGPGGAGTGGMGGPGTKL